MSNEVELKFFDVDIEALRSRISELGGVLDFSGEMWALYYDDAALRLKQGDGALRLRKEPVKGSGTSGGFHTVLTRKESIHEEGVKSCVETETTVDDFDATRRILVSLGFNEVLSIRKHRSSYRFVGGRLEIDTHRDELSHIPPFVELEACSKKDLVTLATELGLDPERGEALNAFGVIEKYKGYESEQ